MTRFEMVQQALQSVGQASCQEIAEFLRREYAVEMEPAEIALICGAIWSQETKIKKWAS